MRCRSYSIHPSPSYISILGTPIFPFYFESPLKILIKFLSYFIKYEVILGKWYGGTVLLETKLLFSTLGVYDNETRSLVRT